jgi:hypothetical protein
MVIDAVDVLVRGSRWHFEVRDLFPGNSRGYMPSEEVPHIHEMRASLGLKSLEDCHFFKLEYETATWLQVENAIEMGQALELVEPGTMHMESEQITLYQHKPGSVYVLPS